MTEKAQSPYAKAAGGRDYKKDSRDKKPLAAGKNSVSDPSGKKSFSETGKSVYGEKKNASRAKAKGGRHSEKSQDEFEQRIVDLARVTRVMAGGKRMRFRACVVIGNRKGKVALGMDKGADVSIAVEKAVTKAKKEILEVPMVNDTIPHEILFKLGAAKLLLKPARKGKGVMAGGAARIVLELAGIKNVTSKNLGTNNNVNVAKCTMKALAGLRKVENQKKDEKAKEKTDNKIGNAQAEKAGDVKDENKKVK
jgi:small subunit ribosomal protein S5